MSEDIFEKYAELAIERGLISKGEGAKEKLEKNPRWDSQDLSAIELLYGVKPDAPKEMEYKKNIVEVAHPNAVIVSPAHDALNGLVENINERNNILINIVMKPVDGQHTGRKYASDELVRSLVRIANDMDNKESDELRVLADTCLEQIHKKGWAMLAVGAEVALLGGIYMQQHMDMADNGFEANALSLKNELGDFKGDHLIGTDYTENFQKSVDQIIERIDLLLAKYKEFRVSIDALQKPKDLEEMRIYLEGRGVTGPEKGDFSKMYQEFNALVTRAYTLFGQIEKRFTEQSYQNEQMKNVGLGERANRLLGKFFSGDKLSLVSNDFLDVLRALVPFKKSLESTLKVLQEADAQAKQEYAAMETKYKADMAGKSNTPAQAAPSAKKNPLEGLDFSSL